MLVFKAGGLRLRIVDSSCDLLRDGLIYIRRCANLSRLLELGLPAWQRQGDRLYVRGLWHTMCNIVFRTTNVIYIPNKKLKKKTKAMKIKPLSDRVLIQPNPAEEKTAAGLIIPDTAKEKPLEGKVIAVGPGTSEIKMEVKVGDEVLYGKYAGTEVTVGGETYLIMRQSDIFAII